MINYSEAIRVKGTEAPARVIGKSEYSSAGKWVVEFLNRCDGWVSAYFDEQGVSRGDYRIENVPPKPETREIEVAGCRIGEGEYIATFHRNTCLLSITKLNGKCMERMQDYNAIEIAEQNMGAVFGPWQKITLEFPVVK